MLSHDEIRALVLDELAKNGDEDAAEAARAAQAEDEQADEIIRAARTKRGGA